MGFSVKIAPGVRVRASSRGVRTSIGPRVARVHVGAGRTGLSTGAGPVGLYTAVGRTRRRPGSRGKSPSIASLQRQAAAARKAEAAAQKAEEAEEAQRLAAALREILDVHRQEFPSAQWPSRRHRSHQMSVRSARGTSVPRCKESACSSAPSALRPSSAPPDLAERRLDSGPQRIERSDRQWSVAEPGPVVDQPVLVRAAAAEPARRRFQPP